MIVSTLSKRVHNVVRDVELMWEQLHRILHYGITSSSPPPPPPSMTLSSSSSIPQYSSPPPKQVLPKHLEDIPIIEHSDPIAIKFRYSLIQCFHKHHYTIITR